MTQPIQTGAVFNEQEAVQSIQRLTGAMNQLLAPINRLAAATERLTPTTRRFTAAQQQSTAAAHAQTRAYHGTSAAMHGMVQHSQAAYAALNRIGSAAQGVMLGQALLQQSLMGVGFSLIFARFAMIRYMAAAAAATVVIGGVGGLALGFTKLQGAANSAARSMEDTGQRMASFFRSADTAQEILTQADEVARKFGVPHDEAVKMLEGLERVELRSNEYIKAILNAAAATGTAISDVGERFNEIVRAGASERGRLIDQFVKDLNLPVKEYANTLQLAEAMNKRFAGSIEAFAQTQSGLIGRLQASWGSFLRTMGSVTQEIVKPMLNLALSFTEGLIKGFQKAKEAGQATGELKRTMDGLKQSVESIMPLLSVLGNFLGRILYQATVKAAQGIKMFLDLFRAFANWLKQFKDILPAVQQAWKTFIDELFSIDLNEVLRGLAVTIRTFFGGLPRTITRSLRGIGRGVGRALRPVLTEISEALLERGYWQNLREQLDARTAGLFSGTGRALRGSARGVTTAIRGILRELRRAILVPGYWQRLYRGISENVTGIPRAIRRALTDIDYRILFRDLQDDLSRGFRAAVRGAFTGLRGLGNIAVSLRRPFRTLAGNIASGLITAIQGVFQGGGGIIRAIRRAITGVFNLPRRFFTSALRGLKSGLVFGLIEALALSVVDLLPIGEQWTKSLKGVLQTTFLGAAVGSIIPGVGTTIGAAVGLAIGGALEMVKPGLSRDFNVFLEESLISGLQNLGKWMQDTALPAIQEFADWIGPKLERAGKTFATWVRQDAVPALQEMYRWFNRNVMPILEDVGNWLKGPGFTALKTFFNWVVNSAIPTLMDVTHWFGTKVWNAINSFSDWLNGDGRKAGNDFFGWLDEFVVPLLDEFHNWWKELILPILKEVWNFLKGPFLTSVQTVFNWIKDTAIPTITDLWEEIDGPLWNDVLKPLAKWLKTELESALIIAKDAFVGVRKAIQFLWNQVLVPFWNNVMKPFVTWVNDELIPAFQEFHNDVLSPLGSFIKDTLWPAFRDYIWYPIRDDILPVVKELGGAFAWFDALTSPFSTLLGALRTMRDIWGAIAGYVEDIVGWIPSIKFPSKPDWVGLPDINLPDVNFGGSNDIPSMARNGGGGGNIPGGEYVPGMQHGGVVPGMPGTRRMIMAEAGEWFLGHPEYSSSRRLMQQAGGNGGGGTHIYLDLREAVVAGEQGVDALANTVSERIVRFLGTGRKITQHRV